MINFNPSPELTIEVVIELQLVNNQNLNLKSYPKKYSQT